MNGTPALIVIALVSFLAGVTIEATTTLASQLPDPGDPGFPAIMGALFAFVGAASSLWEKRGDWKAAQDEAFKYGFVGTGLGLLAYGFGLATDLY